MCFACSELCHTEALQPDITQLLIQYNIVGNARATDDWVETNSPITIDDIPSIDDDQDQGSAFASASASASASGSASENNTPKKNKGVSSAETINGSKKLKAK